MPLNVGTDRRLLVVAANVTQSMKVPVNFINITKLSEYRKDAHTSVHTIRQGKMLTPEQQADPTTFADCIHWCLPGLPDTWNEFLYTRIVSRSWQTQMRSLYRKYLDTWSALTWSFEIFVYINVFFFFRILVGFVYLNLFTKFRNVIYRVGVGSSSAHWLTILKNVVKKIVGSWDVNCTILVSYL